VKDLAGNALADNYGFSFTSSSSGSPPGAVPTVTVRPIETSDILYNPGTHENEAVVAIPADVPAATYTLDVAILTEDAKSAHVELAISGKRPDKWYPVSEVTIKN
jgi:hypothetical protein